MHKYKGQKQKQYVQIMHEPAWNNKTIKKNKTYHELQMQVK